MNRHVVQHPFHIGVIVLDLSSKVIYQMMIFDLVIPNLLLASAYPGEREPDAHQRLTRQIIEAGVQVVVNIMEIEELKRFTPYQDIMLQHAQEGIILFPFLIFR